MSLLLSLTAALLGTALIVVAVNYRRRWLAARSSSAELATSLLESQQMQRELQHEADYWRGLVKWTDEHTDHNPTQEECDLMWQRIVESKPQFAAKPGVVISHDGQIAPHFDSLDELVRSTGGRL